MKWTDLLCGRKILKGYFGALKIVEILGAVSGEGLV